MGFFATVRSFDFYRKIPRDLTEGSLSGALLSLGAAISISLLLGYEFRAYLEPSSTTDVLVDKSLNGEVVPINFKISFPSLPCEWADFDLSNTLGTHFINDDGISSMGVKTMRKFPIDSALREVPSVYQDKPEPIFDENDPVRLLGGGQCVLAAPVATVVLLLLLFLLSFASLFWCARRCVD